MQAPKEIVGSQGSASSPETLTASEVRSNHKNGWDVF